MRAPHALLLRHQELFVPGELPGAVLDLACGDGHNGLYLAARGLDVVLADRSQAALDRARARVQATGGSVEFWRVDLEEEGRNPLAGRTWGAILVFRYLHRPLIPPIREALAPGGVLVYETFTADQALLGRPTNPDFLLRRGELRGWFADWELIEAYEGLQSDPPSYRSGLVCRKPAR